MRLDQYEPEQWKILQYHNACFRNQWKEQVIYPYELCGLIPDSNIISLHLGLMYQGMEGGKKGREARGRTPSVSHQIGRDREHILETDDPIATAMTFRERLAA